MKDVLRKLVPLIPFVAVGSLLTGCATSGGQKVQEGHAALERGGRIIETPAARPASAADWVALRAVDPNATFYVDKSSIERAGNTVRFWEAVVFDRPAQKDELSGNWIKQRRVHRIMNCLNRTQGFSYGSSYTDNGKLIDSETHSDDEVRMTPIPPGSVAYGELRLVCELAGLKTD